MIGIAERTIDIYTAAVLAEQFLIHVDPLPKWRQQMQRLGELSCISYQDLIQQKRFIKYFRQATPELELGSLNIGSRYVCVYVYFIYFYKLVISVCLCIFICMQVCSN